MRMYARPVADKQETLWTRAHPAGPLVNTSEHVLTPFLARNTSNIWYYEPKITFIRPLSRTWNNPRKRPSEPRFRPPNTPKSTLNWGNFQANPCRFRVRSRAFDTV